MESHQNYHKAVEKLCKIKTRQLDEYLSDSSNVAQDLGIYMIKSKFKSLNSRFLEFQNEHENNSEKIRFLQAKMLNLYQDVSKKLEEREELLSEKQMNRYMVEITNDKLKSISHKVLDLRTQLIGAKNEIKELKSALDYL